MKRLFAILVACAVACQLQAQTKERKERLRIDGEIVTALITETDTILIAELDDVSISSPRSFKNRDEYRRYLKYRRYAAIVYPYATKAIRIFKETEYVTQNMKKGKRKRHIKRLQKELKREFKDPLKKLTKTQGKILVKMIEKELNRPFYDLVRELRGGMTAAYWHQLSKFYGYNLKEGYIPGQDHILDAVLRDMDISHDLDY
ncbi:MAG: DUF4294 domain-containing protein [Bacteroidota bacterium]